MGKQINEEQVFEEKSISYYIVGVIKENIEVLGYRVVRLKENLTTCRDFSVADTIALIEKFPVRNASIKNGEVSLVGANSTYSYITTAGTLRGSCGLVVMYNVKKDNEEVVGYGVCDCFGKMVNVRTKALINLAGKYKASNWEVYTLPNGSMGVRSKQGIFPTVYAQANKQVKAYNSGLDSAEKIQKIKEHNEDVQLTRAIEKSKMSSRMQKSNSDIILPALKVYNLDDVLNLTSNKDAQETLYLVKMNLDKIAPYYGIMFGAIEKKACTAIDTMAVTETLFLHNPSFTASLTIEEATFIVIHEMLHIAMNHTARHGERNNTLWNIACDLYINELICRDYKLSFGGKVAEVRRTSAYDGKTYTGVIRTPLVGIFLSTINETLDFAKDTPESIYIRLYKENKDRLNQLEQGQGQQGQQGQGQQGQQGQGQQGQQGQGQQGQQGQGQGQQGQGQGQQGQGQGQQGQRQQGEDGFDKEQQGQGQQGQGQGQQGQGQGQQGQGQGQQGQGQGQQGQGQQGQGQGQQGQGQGQQGQGDDGFEGKGKGVGGASSDLENDTTASDNGEYDKPRDVEVIYKGKTLKGRVEMDIYSNSTSNTQEAKEKRMSDSKHTMTKIKVAKEMAAAGGKDISMTGSSQLCERVIKFAQCARYNWETILRNKAKSDPKKLFTMTKPNKSYMQQGIYLPTQQNVGDFEVLSGLKICIDVSGSVCDEDLALVFTKVKQILDIYKVKAEVIYWSTTVGVAQEFTTISELIKVKPVSDGGTDASCLFEYLLGKNKVDGKLQETRVKDMSAILIFTDGCIPDNLGEYARFFNRNVVWVIDDNAPYFEEPFGVVAKANLSN